MEAIYATDINYGLSKDGNIPWKSKKDMKFFMNKTINNVVIMGRNTYFSIPEEHRPLKNRLNIVLTSNPHMYFKIEDDCKEKNLMFTNNPEIYISIIVRRERYCNMFPFLNRHFKIFIVGGKNIYEQFISICNKVWVTKIKKDYLCDLFYKYNFSDNFSEEIIDDDDELTIFKYTNLLIEL
jgi:dihydrofolate reductase